MLIFLLFPSTWYFTCIFIIYPDMTASWKHLVWIGKR